MRIGSIRVYRLSQPLCEPYHLSYRTISALDSVWVKLELTDGNMGWGESTPLPGYTESDLSAVWATTNNLARAWIGKDANSILVSPPCAQDGFLFTAIWTALEEATGGIPQLTGKVPLVGLVQERAGESPENALQRVRKLSYKAFKIKVGFLSSDEDRNISAWMPINHCQKLAQECCYPAAFPVRLNCLNSPFRSKLGMNVRAWRGLLLYPLCLTNPLPISSRSIEPLEAAQPKSSS